MNLSQKNIFQNIAALSSLMASQYFILHMEFQVLSKKNTEIFQFKYAGVCLYVGRKKILAYLNLAVKLAHRIQSLSKIILKLLEVFNIFEFSFNPNKDSTNNKKYCEIWRFSFSYWVSFFLDNCYQSRRKDKLGAEWLSWAMEPTQCRQIAGKKAEMMA